jgi:hypothetical protein
MNTNTLYQSFLTTHLIGFVLFVGTVIIDFIVVRLLWKQYDDDPAKAKAVSQVISQILLVNRIGALLVIFAGIGMMTIVHGVYGEQLWMRIKIGLVAIAALNGIIVRRRQSIKLQIGLEDPHAKTSLLKVKSSLNLFHSVQLTICFAIILLSVFKFT